MPTSEETILATQIADSRQPHALVVLQSAHNRRCAKHFVMQPDRTIDVVPYGLESHWIPAVVPCPTFDLFCQALELITQFRDRIIVRGGIRDQVTITPIMRRCIGAGATIQPACRSWVALDVDGLVVEEATILAVTMRLPARFRNVACFYQFTSSYGVGRPLNEMRVRLWYQLSHPMSDAAWKRVLRPDATAAKLDLSLYNPVQPHYVAAPTFEHMSDPIGHRSGVFDSLGMAQVVDVADVGDRTEMDEGTVVVSALTRTGIDAHPDQINAILERFATRSRVASRHSTAVALIGELYGHGLSGEESMRHAKRYMEQQGRPPERGELERALAFVQRRAAAGELRTNDVPVSLMFDTEMPGDTGLEAHDALAEATANAEANEPIVAEWPTQPNAMARRAYSDLFAGEGYLRWGKCDFEWTGVYWRRMADDEELTARLQRAADCTPTAASRGAEALRNERHRAFLRPPCLLADGVPVAPRVPLLNGWLSVAEIRAGAPVVLKPHTAEVFDPIAPLPIQYDPEATCSRFDRFLDECFEGDTESRRALIRLMGYLLFKGNEHQRVFICTGAPASGKSTWLRVMRSLLGSERGTVGDLRSFGTDFGLQNIYQAQALFLPEASHGEDGARLDGQSVDQLKRISGGDPVTVRRKYADDVVAEQMPTPVVICNLPPLIRDEAFIRRLVTIHFPRSFIGREDPTLTGTLLRELPGIFNVAVRGLAELANQREPFPPPAEAFDDDTDPTPAREVYEQIRADSSPVGEFARICLVVEGNQWLPRTTLIDTYRRWCAAHERRSMAPDSFIPRLRHAMPSVRWVRRRVSGASGERDWGLEGVRLSVEGTRLQSDTGAF